MCLIIYNYNLFALPINVNVGNIESPYELIL